MNKIESAVKDSPTGATSPKEKKKAAAVVEPARHLLIVLRPTANRNLVWAVLDGKKKDGPVRLRVRDAKFYRNGEQVMAYEVERDLWEAVEHRRGPRYGRMQD